MTRAKTKPMVGTAAELLVYAHQMELEAQERYTDLADQMDTHNNDDLAKVFRMLAWVEGLHAREIKNRMKGMEVPKIGSLDFNWPNQESPEALDLGDMHYMMTPRQALLLALRAEQDAAAFFTGLRDGADDPTVKALAREFAEEESEHVELVLKELEKYPDTGATPIDDMDPPIAQA